MSRSVRNGSIVSPWCVVWLLTIATACAPGVERSRREPALDRKVFEAVNAERARHGIPVLKWHDGAAEAARAHSRAMADRRFFSHTDPERGDLEERLRKGRVRWTAMAENLFQQRGCADAVRCAVDGWLASAGHRRNLLNDRYTHSGVGVVKDRDGTVYYTQIFVR